MSVSSSELVPPTPFPASDCDPPLGTKWGGGSNTRLRVGREWGDPIWTTGEKALHSVYSVPHPLPPSKCVSPLEPTGEATLARGCGVGEPNSDDWTQWTESLALCILCDDRINSYRTLCWNFRTRRARKRVVVPVRQAT